MAKWQIYQLPTTDLKIAPYPLTPARSTAQQKSEGSKPFSTCNIKLALFLLCLEFTLYEEKAADARGSGKAP